MIKVIIADDHKVFRQGVASLIAGNGGDTEVIGEAGSGEELLGLLKEGSPDVILMDIDMGGSNGIKLTEQITKEYPSVRVLAFSMHEEKNYVMKMLEAGATGYLLKNAGKDEMMNAIRSVAAGDGYFSHEISTLLLRQFSKKDTQKESKAGEELTRREIEILQLIAEEYSNPEIAEKLFISIRTVDTHRRNLLEKLRVKNTAGLVKYAIKNNLLDN